MQLTHDVTFNDVPADVFAKMQEQLLGIHGGCAIDNNTIELGGVRCTYHYDPSGHALHISVLTTPSVVTQGHVVGWIHDAIRRLESESK